MFAFIFFGIRAFSLGGSFNSVVNSVLPMCNFNKLNIIIYINNKLKLNLAGGGGATASSTNEFED